MKKPNAADSTHRFFRKMTVAHIRENSRAQSVEVIFLESAQFYRLLRSNPAFEDILNSLRGAIASGCALTVGFVSPESEIIEEVAEA